MKIQARLLKFITVDTILARVLLCQCVIGLCLFQTDQVSSVTV